MHHIIGCARCQSRLIVLWDTCNVLATAVMASRANSALRCRTLSSDSSHLNKFSFVLPLNLVSVHTQEGGVLGVWVLKNPWSSDNSKKLKKSGFGQKDVNNSTFRLFRPSLKIFMYAHYSFFAIRMTWRFGEMPGSRRLNMQNLQAFWNRGSIWYSEYIVQVVVLLLGF